MPYTIDYITNEGVSTETWRGNLAEAQILATRAVESGGIDRVEVRDAGGDLLFHYPRVTHSGRR